MMTYDPVTDSFLPFGKLRSVTSHDTNEGHDMRFEYRPCCKSFDIVLLELHTLMSSFIDVVFDVLKVNDRSLLQFSLATRRRFLYQLIQQERGTLHILQHETGTTVARVLEVLDQVLLSKGEGLVIKDPESPYRPGVRGVEWLKVKPDYLDEMGEHLDVVIIGE
jgi:DNA ligase-4